MNTNCLVRFVVYHSAVGAAAGVGFVVLLIAFDIARLRTLIFASDVGLLAASILAVFFAITFGSVQVGLAVMEKAHEADGSDGPPGPPAVWRRFGQRVAPVIGRAAPSAGRRARGNAR